MGGSQLTAKRQAFIAEYLKCWNATEAARRAGYRYPNKQGPALVNLGIVAEAIKARLAEKAMTADEVLARLAEQARAEYAQYLCDDGTVDLQKMIDDGKAHLVKGTKWNRQGNLVVEFHDAQSALVHIGRHLQLFTDNVHHSGSLGPLIAVLPTIEEPEQSPESPGDDDDDALAPA